MSNNEHRLTRIGLFYDGNYFSHVSNYYQYVHEREARISISGLNAFIRNRVAKDEGVDEKGCQIVDSHYFRGRLSAQAAEQKDMLLRERIFDDVLMREGVTTHFYPLGAGGEKSIDVWLALEAYEMAIYKRYDVCVLIAGDGDFVPLLRKLNTIGTRVMLLAWDLKYVDQNGVDKETRASQALIDAATYPVSMSQIIDERATRDKPIINGLFVTKSEVKIRTLLADKPATKNVNSDLPNGIINNMKSGYGFITPDDGSANIFFHHTGVMNADFEELKAGDKVEYEVGQNEKGPCAVNIRVLS
jgi:cold shock CspA family protein/uncharacterized LabA/DUF88 family protein